MEIEEVRSVSASDFQNVAEAFCRYQADLHAAALRQRIYYDGRAMNKKADFVSLYPGLAQNVQHAFFVIRRRRVRLRRRNRLRASLPVDRKPDQVREGTADIGRHPNGLDCHVSPPIPDAMR